MNQEPNSNQEMRLAQLWREHNTVRNKMLICEQKLRQCKLTTNNIIKKKQALPIKNIALYIRERETGWPSRPIKKHYSTMCILINILEMTLKEFEFQFFTFLKHRDVICNIHREITELEHEMNSTDSYTDSD